jgi:PAS domain S-box-containing protein
MHPVSYIELVSVVACLAAIVFLLCGWRRPGFLPATRILLLVLLVLMMFYGAALFMEWSGLGQRFRWHFIEDFASVFIPLIWAFVFYAFVKNAVESDLEKSRQHFRNLVESTSDWIWEVDAKGRYTYASPRVEAILGYTPQELKGKTPFDLMRAEDAERVSAIFAEIVTEKRAFQDLVNVNLHKDGHEVILETNGTPIFDNTGNLTGYRGVDRDITRRLENERLQRQQQAELDSVFRASAAGIGLVRNRYLVRCNRRFSEIVGYPEDDLIGIDPRRYYLSDQDYAAVGDKYAEALAEGFARIETQFIRKDQTIIDVVLYFSPLDRGDADKGFVVVTQDITEYKAARRQALAEKTRAQIYLDVVNVMILVLDTAGHVTMINKKGCELLGRSADQIEGVDWFKQFLPASYRAIARNAFQRILAGDEKSVAYFENPIRTTGGAEKLIAWRNAALLDESGRIAGVISSGEDITEARAAEDAMRKSDERLRVALSAAQMGTWRWEIATDQDVRDANLNAMLGLPAEETVQSKEDFFKFVHPDDCQAARMECERAIRERNSCQVQFRIVRPDGEIRWVLDKGKPFYDYNGKLEYMTGVVVDITERTEYRQRYRNIINSAPIGILTYELTPDGQLLLTGSNPSANTILGHDFTPSVGKPIEEVFPELVNTFLPDEYRRICREGGCYHGDNFEYRDERVSGFYEFDAFQTSPGNVAVAFTDVTERKLAEEQIRQSRDLLKQEVERFENMFHTIPDPIYMKDLDSRFTHVNEAYLKLAGLADEQDVIGKTDFDTYNEERARSFYEDEREILRTGIPKVGYEEKGLWLDGRVTWHLSTKMPLRDAAGNIIGLIGISHDITDRKRADQALQESEEKYRTIFHSGNQGFFLMTDVFLDCNDRVCEIWQCSPEEVIGHSPVEFSPEFQPDGRTSAEAAKAYIDAALAGRPQRFYWQHKRKDGQLVDTEITLDRLQLNEQTLLQATMSDITERKVAERQREELMQKLQESEAHLSKLISLAPSGICVMKGDVYVSVNDRFCETTGYSREELIGEENRGVNRKLYESDAEYEAVGQKIYEQIRDDGIVNIETRILRKDGTLVDNLVSGVPLDPDNLEKGILFAGLDITERKKDQQKLRDSEAYLSSLVRMAPIGICVMKDRVYVSVNESFCDITGYSMDEMIGQTNRVLYESDAEYEAVSKTIYGQLRNTGMTNVETRIRRKDGSPADILISGVPLDPDNLENGILFSGMDITDRKLAEQQLKFTQFAVDHAGEAAYWTGKDAKFIYANDLACQSLGYTREELLSISVPDIGPDFPFEAWPAHWEQLRKERTMRFESHYKKKDGTIFPVEITSNFVEYDGAEYNCAFARDITERKVAEQMREVLMQQLRERNDELQSIVFTTAHDLRSPLVNIAGFAGELEKGLQKLEEMLAGQKLTKQAAKDIEYLIKTDIAESLGFVRSGSHHMDMLLNGLMRLSVVGAASIEPGVVNMNDVFDSIIEGLQYQINESTIDISVPKDLPSCFGDFGMLTQVFSNLIENAIKYRHPDRAAVIEIGASIQDDRVEYTVADNGIGIDSPHLEKVFELFHRLHPREEQGGEGLGLTIVRRILDRLGGTARIESVPDRGTTVYVRLPRG